MPTSKHRKKHKQKLKQRRNDIAQKKNAYNKQMQRYQEQVELLNKQYQDHLAAGGKAEDFQPLQQLIKGVPVEENGTTDDLVSEPSTEIEDAIVIDEKPTEQNITTTN